ncbi:MAG: hypothetical protein JO053_01730 [Acidobacteria bacterium]|nr:hypothetical protein [Acidobacteriota bacterium]
MKKAGPWTGFFVTGRFVLGYFLPEEPPLLVEPLPLFEPPPLLEPPLLVEPPPDPLDLLPLFSAMISYPFF